MSKQRQHCCGLGTPIFLVAQVSNLALESCECVCYHMRVTAKQQLLPVTPPDDVLLKHALLFLHEMKEKYYYLGRENTLLSYMRCAATSAYSISKELSRARCS